MPDGSASGGHIQFLVQQENAGRIREEHPWCAGTAMSSVGGGIAKPTAQLQLNLAAKGAEGLGPGEAVVDRSKAPTKKVIQQTMTDRRRSGRRGLQGFDIIDRILRCVFDHFC